MRANIRAVSAELDQPITEQDVVEAAIAEAANEAAQDVAADAMENALQGIQTERAPTRIKKAKDWTDKLIADLMPQEQRLQTELAAADQAYENKVADAQAERERIKASLSADLKQVTALRAATAVFQGELRKAEL